MSFAHLHVHTEYSLLDGAARIKNLIAKTKELGMDAIAITDHGVMFGVIDFYKEAKSQGIKPIIGCEVYTSARRMQDKEGDKDKRQGHLVLLAKDQVGYHNLVKIVSAGFTEGFYYKPRVDHEMLRQHSEGLIALTACLAGNVQQNLLRNDYEGAKKEVLTLVDIFGKDNVYLELQDQGLEEEQRIYPMMVRLHEETGLPFVATNDVHYVNQEDAKAHDVLLCIQTATTVDDENRMRFSNDQFYLKSEREMQQLFGHIEGALENTAKVAERCNVEFTFGEYHLPEFRAPDGLDNVAYFKKLCYDGLHQRYHVTDGDSQDPEKQQEKKALIDRLEYEVNTIVDMGYVEYFLIVWDFINYARQKGIMVGPGRGSAAGSIVAYCLHITDIDPIRYGLIFERFLNPDRISMPDIDIDFCYERRQEVINYVIEKYGEDKVAQIITFGTMKAKAAIRDVGRALNMSYGEVDAIAKKVPFDLKMTLSKALDMNPELKRDYDNDVRVKELIDTAKALEGMPRHASTHAAGVVISKKSINEYVPLYLAEKGISTQFTMTTIEELGLLKMDFLGLRNLTVIRDALELIRENHQKTIDFSSMIYDDPKVFELIGSGNTMGVFQMESGGMRQFVKNLRPDCFEDIVAGISLYRPGPMNSIPTYIENKRNPAHVRYLHPKLEPILSVTYGCMVYQEQVMQIVRELAGYSFSRSDLVRRAMSKKKRDAMELEREYFVHGKLDEQGDVEIPGCVRNGVPEKIANEIYDQMISFAEYAFNKSHAAAYAVLAYETAYLKVYYPVEFMAALMTSVIGDAGQIAKYIRNCVEMKIEVLPPDVCESGKKFTVRGDKIRFGLLGVKNVGEGVIDALISLREEKGNPKDIFQMMNEVDIHEINKKALESLIKAGALDCFTENRAAQLAVYEGLVESAQSESRKNIEGQISLFQFSTEIMEEAGTVGRLPEVKNFSAELLMAMEKEMLGVYITGHPLSDYAEKIQRIATINTEELTHAEENPQLHDGDSVVVAGIINTKKTLITKKNQMMAFVQLEDLFGSVEVIVFPNVYEKSASCIREDSIIAVKGTINFKEEEAPKILANRVTLLSDYPENVPQKLVKLVIPDTMEEDETLAQVRMLLAEYPGDIPVAMMVQATGRKFKTKSDLWVTPTEAFWDEAAELLGEENIRR